MNYTYILISFFNYCFFTVVFCSQSQNLHGVKHDKENLVSGFKYSLFSEIEDLSEEDLDLDPDVILTQKSVRHLFALLNVQSSDTEDDSIQDVIQEDYFVVPLSSSNAKPYDGNKDDSFYRNSQESFEFVKKIE